MEFLPRFAVLDAGSPSAASLRAIDLRYESPSWFPVPSGDERLVTTLIAKLTAHVGVDDRVEPSGRNRATLVRAFRGWSTVIVTDKRLVGVCVRGHSVSGPIDIDRGTVVGWTFPFSHVQAAAVVEASGRLSVAVRSTDELTGALLIANPRKPLPTGGHQDLSLEELAAILNQAAWRASQSEIRDPRPPAAPAPPTPRPDPVQAPVPAPPPASPPPPAPPPQIPRPAAPSADDGEQELDSDLLRAGLGELKPVCEYVSYLARGERSPRLGVGVDGFGRIDLERPPPHGRYLTVGQLWITTTEDGRAATDEVLAQTTKFRFGPILQGGIELAIFDDHILGVCTTGGCLVGKLGEDGRMPALLFRLDLDLLEEVSINTKAALLGGTKETGFGLVRAGFPSLAIQGETIARIDGSPSWDAKADGSKTSKGEAGRQIAVAAASMRLKRGDRNQDILHRVIAGEWRQEGDSLAADLVPDDDDDADVATATPATPATPASTRSTGPTSDPFSGAARPDWPGPRGCGIRTLTRRCRRSSRSPAPSRSTG